MNTFFVVSVQNMGDGSQPVGIYGYADLNTAMMAYHQTCASNRANKDVASYLCMVLNAHGGTEIKEYYESPIESEA